MNDKITYIMKFRLSIDYKNMQRTSWMSLQLKIDQATCASFNKLSKIYFFCNQIVHSPALK